MTARDLARSNRSLQRFVKLSIERRAALTKVEELEGLLAGIGAGQRGKEVEIYSAEPSDWQCWHDGYNESICNLRKKSGKMRVVHGKILIQGSGGLRHAIEPEKISVIEAVYPVVAMARRLRSSVTRAS